MLGQGGWEVNHKRVERIWRMEGLKVPAKQPRRRRLWLNDGSCVRLRPEHKDHVWSYDFVMARTTDGRAFKILVIIDEYTRECLDILVQRRITSGDVLERLYWLFLVRGTPEHIRSDNVPEFTAKVVREWLRRVEVKTLYIEDKELDDSQGALAQQANSNSVQGGKTASQMDGLLSFP